jgi:Cu/Ag efflux protein CusF
MRTLLVPAVAAALLATSAFAFAAQHATGTIKTYDAKAMTVTLADGSTYMLPKKFKDPGLRAGEKVAISWEKSGTGKLADQVKIVK